MICKKCGAKLIQNDKYCKECQTSCLSQIKLNNYSMDKDFVSFMNSIGIKCDKSDAKNPTITVPNDFKDFADNVNISGEIPLVNEYDTNENIYEKEEFQNQNKFKRPNFSYEPKFYHNETNSNTSICDNMIIGNENIRQYTPQSDNAETFEEDTYKYDKTTIYLIFILIIVIIVSVASMIIMYSKDKKEKEPVNNIVTNITTNVTEDNTDESIIYKNNSNTSTTITSTTTTTFNFDTDISTYIENRESYENNEEYVYNSDDYENSEYDKSESDNENSYRFNIDTSDNTAQETKTAITTENSIE
ncbi:MAG: hypothetical protein IJZ64_00115 [Ruminococcus sp.]|nr:hypothetical protein [Ruminococcus sp.]